MGLLTDGMIGLCDFGSSLGSACKLKFLISLFLGFEVLSYILIAELYSIDSTLMCFIDRDGVFLISLAFWVFRSNL